MTAFDAGDRAEQSQEQQAGIHERGSSIEHNANEREHGDKGCELQGGMLVVHDRGVDDACLLYTSPSPRDGLLSRMPSSA